jgi:hypothetical protein
MRLRIPGNVAFIGTVGADTVFADAGAMRYTAEPGHYGALGRRPPDLRRHAGGGGIS